MRQVLALHRAKSPDGIGQLTAASNNGDPEVLEVLRRQIGQDRLVYLIIVETPSPSNNTEWLRARRGRETYQVDAAH